MKPLHLAIGALLFLGVALFFGALRSSVFLKNRERVNVVLYGNPATFYSIGRGDGTDYQISFYPDFEASVPGGYGTYRVGGLGKLASLDRNPNLLGRTFSLLTSSFVTLSFYPAEATVYFGDTKGTLQWPSFSTLFFGKSNASLLDRLFIFWLFIKNPPSEFTRLPLDTSNEGELYKGYWYDKTYRIEKKNVQIIYTKSYPTAERISHMIEGQGIRVADISEKNYKGPCVILIKTESESANAMRDFLGCTIKKGETGPYDILLQLGDIESDWEVH